MEASCQSQRMIHPRGSANARFPYMSSRGRKLGKRSGVGVANAPFPYMSSKGRFQRSGKRPGFQVMVSGSQPFYFRARDYESFGRKKASVKIPDAGGKGLQLGTWGPLLGSGSSRRSCSQVRKYGTGAGLRVVIAVRSPKKRSRDRSWSYQS
ncbi:tRNA1(Val) (adenine(37)-N6)-methyltransferase, partial [Striga asiatica]